MTPFVYTQQSEMLVPKEASTVFSINNIDLLKKVSLRQLQHLKVQVDGGRYMVGNILIEPCFCME